MVIITLSILVVVLSILLVAAMISWTRERSKLIREKVELETECQNVTKSYGFLRNEVCMLHEAYCRERDINNGKHPEKVGELPKDAWLVTQPWGTRYISLIEPANNGICYDVMTKRQIPVTPGLLTQVPDGKIDYSKLTKRE